VFCCGFVVFVVSRFCGFVILWPLRLGGFGAAKQNSKAGPKSLSGIRPPMSGEVLSPLALSYSPVWATKNLIDIDGRVSLNDFGGKNNGAFLKSCNNLFHGDVTFPWS